MIKSVKQFCNEGGGESGHSPLSPLKGQGALRDLFTNCTTFTAHCAEGGGVNNTHTFDCHLSSVNRFGSGIDFVSQYFLLFDL